MEVVLRLMVVEEEALATVPALAQAQAIVEAAMLAVSAAAPALPISKSAIKARGWTSNAHLELYAIPIPPVAVSSSATILAAAAAATIHLEVVIHPEEAATIHRVAVAAIHRVAVAAIRKYQGRKTVMSFVTESTNINKSN
jgi:hypothetical protein